MRSFRWLGLSNYSKSFRLIACSDFNKLDAFISNLMTSTEFRFLSSSVLLNTVGGLATYN